LVQRLLEALRRNRLQLVLALGVLLLFALNAAGGFQLVLDMGPSSSSLSALLHSPEFL